MNDPVHKAADEEWVDPYPQKARSIQWFSVTLLVVAFYFLSVGPACRLAQKKVISWNTVGTVYAPLDYLCDKLPILDRGIQWYIQTVWQVTARR